MAASILPSKSVMTKFQVLTEIAAHQPNVRQKEIAQKIGVTPQAVSEYIKELTAEGKIHSDGRVRYRITKEGVEWVLENATELKHYSHMVMEDIISHVSTWAAICDEDFEKGEEVNLVMREGLLYATREETGTSGTAIQDGKAGEDIGVTDLKGYLNMKTESITICKVPRIKKGGSSAVDLERLKPIVETKPYIAAVGTEALISLRKIGKEPVVMFGATDSVIQAAYHGLASVIVVVEDEVSYFLARLETENVSYELIDLTKER